MINRKTIFRSLVLILIATNNVSAEIVCDLNSEIDAQSIKLGPTQKQNKSIETKSTIVENNKNTKSDNSHFGVLKLLIPGGLR